MLRDFRARGYRMPRLWHKLRNLLHKYPAFPLTPPARLFQDILRHYSAAP